MAVPLLSWGTADLTAVLRAVEATSKGRWEVLQLTWLVFQRWPRGQGPPVLLPQLTDRTPTSHLQEIVHILHVSGWVGGRVGGCACEHVCERASACVRA